MGEWWMGHQTQGKLFRGHCSTRTSTVITRPSVHAVNGERLWRLPKTPSHWTMIASFPDRHQIIATSLLHMGAHLHCFRVLSCVCSKIWCQTFTAVVTTESHYYNVLVKGTMMMMLMMVDKLASKRDERRWCSIKETREGVCLSNQRAKWN